MTNTTAVHKPGPKHLNYSCGNTTDAGSYNLQQQKTHFEFGFQRSYFYYVRISTRGRQ